MNAVANDYSHGTLVGRGFETEFNGARVHVIAWDNGEFERTAEGMVYWFTPQERKKFILHKHLREDGPFDNPWVSGRIHGVGIRSRIYWRWFAQVECLQRALEYLDRSAFGVELWRYPGNSAKAKADTERAAKRSVSGLPKGFLRA